MTQNEQSSLLKSLGSYFENLKKEPLKFQDLNEKKLNIQALTTLVIQMGPQL